ncbi:MAG: protein phosphatase 2C domain-containing protein [Oscillospiraceae bacterium]|nr:protein phosphatase 2C domain-containing protein [Oscillospiraceae bacterium]
MIDRYLIGNAQTIGRREIQNNIFSTVYNDDGDLLAVLADGAVDHPNGRIAAIVAVGCCVNTFIQKFARAEPTQTNQFLYDTAMKANRNVQDAVFIGKSPRLSLTMTLFRANEMYYFSVGVNKIFLYNGHNEFVLGSDANKSRFEGKCDLSPKDIVGILSTGAYENAHPMERIKIIGSKTQVFDKAQAIIEAVNKRGLEKQLSATALLVEVLR